MSMFLRPPAADGETADAASRSTRTWTSSRSSSTGRASSMSSSSSSSLSGISNGSSGAYDHQQEGSSAGDGNCKEEVEALEVGVAVGKEVKECKANLMWVLSNMDAIIACTGDKTTTIAKMKATVVVLHVHRPAKTIPFMGANFPAEQLHESEVSAFRQAETQAMNRAMAKYRAICAKVKVPAVCRVVTVGSGGDVAQGILRLVAQHGIRRLVVGAAADKRYSSKMTAASSRTAASVQQHAPPLCAIWFLCRGKLVCTRPAAVVDDAVNNVISPTATTHDAAVAPPRLPLAPPPAAYTATAARSTRPEGVQLLGTFIQSLTRNDDEEDGNHHHNQQHQQVVAALEAQVVSSKRVIQDLQEKLSEAHCMLFSLEREQEDLRRQRDAALREAAALRDRLRHMEEEEMTTMMMNKQQQQPAALVELSYDDLLEATQNLDESLKLGRGGAYGSVYRAVLRRKQKQQAEEEEVVAVVKVLNTTTTNNHLQFQFQQQVEALSKLRHPNVVPLLGACSAPEAWALVYEYLPGGSLEDRLAGAGSGSTLTLLWPERTRIAAEVRSALVFLHQNSMVHGDLKPANVLLGPATAKLADSGLCRLLEDDAGAGAVLLRCTMSASSLAYMDPEFLASGELRPASDAYAFGVLLLLLLTGRTAMGLARQLQAALAEGRLPEIMDASAGDWPYTQQQAEQLAHLAVRCCDMAGENRPDLAGEMVAQTLGCFQLQ